jgi:Domain of unknown function (DUF1707)
MSDSLPELRASDADRDRTAEELEERLHSAYEARTQAELAVLVADVPADDQAPAGRVPVRRGEGGSRWVVSILGGSDRKGHWRLGRRCTVINILGGSDLDLNHVELADDYVELSVFALLGGAEIHVPEGLNVEVSEFALLGGNEVELGVARPDPGGPVLRIRILSILGGTDVQRGRKLTRAERKAERLARRAERRG